MDDLLKIYKDRLQIMCILCAQSHTFFNQMKNIMMITSLLITSTLAILNSISTDLNELKIPNIVLNTFLAFIIALSNQLRFSENGDKFHKLFNAFSKLEHTIDKELNSNTMTPDKLNSIIEKYDLLLETCEGIPGFIKRRIRAKYIESNLPFMINHVTPMERQEHIIRTKTLSNPSFGDNVEANEIV
jgi:energy-converting hydrogenase Eha subunit G